MSQQQKKAERDVELLDECWELIFNRLGDDYRFEVISLVSKQFLSVSSCLKRSLTIADPAIRFHCNLSHLFRRFHKVSRINLSCFEISEQEFNDILVDISRSGLDLEQLHVWNSTKIDVEVFRELGSNMNNLTTLKFGFSNLDYLDLVAITSSVPQLQLLDIKPGYFEDKPDLTDGFLTDDEGLEVIASKVRQLRRIDMYRVSFLTDQLLIALCSNCEFLTELVVGCSYDSSCQLTENGICFILRHCQNLMSLSLSGVNANNYSVSSVPSTLFSFENSISHARVLHELEIHHMVVSDVMLCSIAKARLPLKKLAIWSCKDFSYSGLSFLLKEYQSINHLRLGGIGFLTDQMMNDLSMFLHNVTHLEICYCFLLSDPTFFILTRKCPFLIELKLEHLRLGQGGNFPLSLTENHNINALQLGRNRSLNDESLQRFGLICPNIRVLDLRGRSNITEKGIGEILKSCSKLTHLAVNMYKGARILDTGSELSELNLEVLQASGTLIDDEEMALIGTRCRRLLQLDVNMCWKLTKKGVKEVLEKCINLREINLLRCRRVTLNVVPWMISLRPSLRKIIPPWGLVSKEEQRNLFLRHGCVVCDQ